MNKERELLRKILRDTQYINYECNDKIRNEIKELLAQPEQEPLSDEEIEDIYEEHSFTIHAFARAIEKAHGIP